MRYPILIEKIDGEYIATISHPSGRFQGACSATSKAEVKLEAEKMIEAVIASALADGEEIPNSKDCDSGNDYVILPALLSAKVALFIEMRKQGKRKADLAKMLGVNQKQIDRMFSPVHASVLSQLQAAAEALGKKLEVRLA
jgi:antitoxin HicB